MSAPHPKFEDNRSPAQLAVAACTGADGSWRCASVKKPATLAALGSTSGANLPLAWTIPNWYTDPANTTGCASDSNSCTSGTCVGSGVGPCVNVNEIVNHRWQTTQPILIQNTTITVESSETVAQENINLQPLVVQGTYFALVGTPVLVGTVTLGTVTAKNRATATLLQSTGFTTGAIGDMLLNTTSGKSSNAWIFNLVGSTATISQPLVPVTASANASSYPSTMPSEVDTWASGDTVQVYTLPQVNVANFAPVGGEVQPSLLGGVGWMQYVHIPDPAGAPSNSYYTSGITTGCIDWIVNSEIDPYVVTVGTFGGGVTGGFVVNSFLNGGDLTATTMFGGMAANNPTGGAIGIDNYAAIDGDAIINGVFSETSPTFLGEVYVSNIVQEYGSALIKLDDVWDIGATIYGPASVTLGDQSAMERVYAGTWTSVLLLSGGLQMNGGTTATSFAAGTWTTGRTLTQANIDTYSGLQNPLTGSKFYNQ